MLILVINSGSSSVKYMLFNTIKNKQIIKGIIENIGKKTSTQTHVFRDRLIFGNKKLKKLGHFEAIKLALNTLFLPGFEAISKLSDIKAVGHRVVHGGERFKKPTLIDSNVIKYIEKVSLLAPLHNPPSLLGIKACQKLLPDIAQVACFDTSFHQTIPERAFLYGLPYKYYNKYKIRRYGFHGTSHEYISLQASKILKKPLSKLKLITCHLGNGVSITAVNRGKSIDTSMGFTPLEGLLMGTRCGDIDVEAVLFLMRKEKLSIRRIEEILNKESGLFGVSGISNDMRKIYKSMCNNNRKAKIAIDIFIYRIVKYIGAYIAVLNGCDAIVFTAGIGENQPQIVNRIKNSLNSIIKKFNIKILIIPTNEELMIAYKTCELISKFRKR